MCVIPEEFCHLLRTLDKYATTPYTVCVNRGESHRTFYTLVMTGVPVCQTEMMTLVVQVSERYLQWFLAAVPSERKQCANGSVTVSPRKLPDRWNHKQHYTAEEVSTVLGSFTDVIRHAGEEFTLDDVLRMARERETPEAYVLAHFDVLCQKEIALWKRTARS